MATATSTDTKAVIESLNVDLQKEHAAIVMYLAHALRMGRHGIAEDVRRISREEMWHMEWLGEAITELGGKPSVARDEVFNPDSIRASLQKDLEAEQGAVEHYKHTLSLLGEDDEHLRRLIERIVDDERAHEARFRELIGEVERLGERALHPVEMISMRDAETIAPNIQREYQGLLQYMWNKFACGEGEEAEKQFEISVNEMRHMTWLGGWIIGTTTPQLAFPKGSDVETPSSCDASLAVADDYEQTAMSEYMHSRDVVVDEGLRTLLNHIIYQHDYHQFQLQELREE